MITVVGQRVIRSHLRDFGRASGCIAAFTADKLYPASGLRAITSRKNGATLKMQIETFRPCSLNHRSLEVCQSALVWNTNSRPLCGLAHALNAWRFTGALGGQQPPERVLVSPLPALALRFFLW